MKYRIEKRKKEFYLDIIRNPATSGITNLGNAISEHEPDFNVELSNV